MKRFLKFVEIQTKIASMVPFLAGTIFAVHRYKAFDFKIMLMMLISLLCIDMATTGMNNYFDHKHVKVKHGYNYEVHNAISAKLIGDKTALLIIVVLLIIATGMGILLFIETNVMVLLIGCLSFAVGILYSAGPLPISRTPLGEVFSGFFMGSLIFFLSVYIQIVDQSILVLAYSQGILSLSVDLLEFIIIFLVSGPMMLCIANIMLANNICDMDEDILNGRHTLPIVIGLDKALLVFRYAYYLAMILIVGLSLFGILPYITGLCVPLFVVVIKHIKLFYNQQSKKDTFVLSVKNFMVFAVVLILPLMVNLFL